MPEATPRSKHTECEDLIILMSSFHTNQCIYSFKVVFLFFKTEEGRNEDEILLLDS